MVYKNNSYGYFYKLNGGSQTSQANLISTTTTGLWTVPDPDNTSQPFTGTLSSFAWGLNTDFAGAGNTYWAAIYVDGVRLTDGFTTLTHSSDTNLSKFTTGTSVTQNSGHTPTTSAITSVSTNATSQTTTPGRGTGSTLQNYNEDHIFNVDTTANGWSTTIQSISNKGDATACFFWWSVDKVTWQRVYSRNISLLPFTLDASNVNQDDFQYLIVTINSSSYLTNASVTVTGDAQIGGETVLTLTDDTDLENFRSGDTVIDPTTTLMSVEATSGSFDQSAMQERIKKGICHNASGYTNGDSINTSINSSGRNKAANKFCTYNGNAIAVRATYDTPVPTTSTVNLIGGAYSNAAITITFKIFYSDGTDATITADSSTNNWTWDNDFSTGGKSVSGWEISGSGYVIIHGLVVDGASSFTVDNADYKVIKVVSGSNQLWTNGGTWSANDVAKTTLQAAPTGTVAFSSGSKLSLSSSSGRWISNANKTATKSSSYDTALTFADNTNLNLIIGTATQSNSDATDYNSATTSAITSVTGGGQVTVANCSESISAGGGAYQTGDMFGSTETTTYTRPNGSSYYSISGPDNVLTVNAGETIGVRGNGASQTTTAYMRIGNTTVAIGTLSSGLWSNINAYSQATTTSPVSGKIDRVWVESNDSNGDAGISRIIVNNQIVINGNTLNRSADLDLTDNTNLSLFSAGQVVQYGTAYSASAGNRDISGGMFTAFPGRYGDFDASGAAVTFDVTLASPVTARYIGHSMILGNYSATSNENTSIISITKLNGSTVSHSGSGSWSQLSNGYGIAHIDLGSSQSISSFTLRVDTTVSSNYYVGEGIYLGGSSTNTSSKIISTVPNAEVISVDTSNNSILTNGGTWSTGDTVTANFNAATIGSVELASGSTLYGSNVSGTFIQGKYLRGATVTAEAPSPSEIVFTSSNAGTTAYSGTDATLTSRIWKLESGSSNTGPWSLVGNYIDTSVASSQDGATEWPTAPTLSENTYFRVGVTYVASNAADVVSSNNIFKTGDA
jgi:hypothetical protein